MKGRPNETARRALDLRPLLEGERGVFYIVAQGVGRSWSEARATVNVTDLGLTVTMGREGGRDRARPLRLVGEARRGREGHALVALEPARRRGRDGSRRPCEYKA